MIDWDSILKFLADHSTAIGWVLFFVTLAPVAIAHFEVKEKIKAATGWMKQLRRLELILVWCVPLMGLVAAKSSEWASDKTTTKITTQENEIKSQSNRLAQATAEQNQQTEALARISLPRGKVLDGARFISNLKQLPKGIARILVIEGDQEASNFATYLWIVMGEAGWRVYPPQDISLKETKQFSWNSGLGGFGLVAARSEANDDFSPFDPSKAANFFTATNAFDILKTNTPFWALNAAFRNCQFGPALSGYSTESNGVIKIIIGQKIW